jgi:SAM-dependent methyltransferase
VVARRVKGAAARTFRLGELGVAGDAGAVAHYADPAYYDRTYRDRQDDVAYYIDRALSAAGPVLEYGVGSGRIALPLARMGVEVVGVDLSKEMLTAFEAKLARETPEVAARVRLVRGDMRSVRLRRRFALVIAPFNAVQHLYSREDIEAFFRGVQLHLAPGGRFVFDFLLPSPDDLGADPERRYRAPRFSHPTRGLTRYSERFEYDPIRQLLLVHMEFTPEDGSPGWTAPLTHRQYFPEEMSALLHYAGMTDVRMTADFTGRAPSALSESIVVDCRARRGASRPAAPRRGARVASGAGRP